jgi:hypothetical protein
MKDSSHYGIDVSLELSAMSIKMDRNDARGIAQLMSAPA